MDFKSSSGMLSSSNNDIQKKKIQNLIHSLSSIGPSVSMEMPLAKAPDKVTHIMAWHNGLPGGNRVRGDSDQILI